MQILAPSKLNLFLHVTGRRADGYHTLQSLMAYTEISDSIEVSESDSFRLQLQGETSAVLQESEQNIVERAVRLVAKEGGVTPNIAVKLTKNIPVGAGLGGGSADAAAMLHLLKRYWQLNLSNKEWYEMALALGADVPFCYHGNAALVEGIGERLVDIKQLPSYWVVLVNPNQPLSTQRVFQHFTEHGSFSDPIHSHCDSGDGFLPWLKSTRNDLEPHAIAIMPEIKTILDCLRQQKNLCLARMSGSGATCFGLFKDQISAKAAVEKIKEHTKNWWVELTILKSNSF